MHKATCLGENVVPHTLRHTAATWLAINDTPFALTVEYVGISVETYARIYRHHALSYQEQARNAITAKPKP